MRRLQSDKTEEQDDRARDQSDSHRLPLCDTRFIPEVPQAEAGGPFPTVPSWQKAKPGPGGVRGRLLRAALRPVSCRSLHGHDWGQRPLSLIVSTPGRGPRGGTEHHDRAVPQPRTPTALMGKGAQTALLSRVAPCPSGPWIEVNSLTMMLHC